jgi:hypothetical protein
MICDKCVMTDTSGKCDFKYLYDEDEDECEMFYKESDIRCVVHIYGDDDEVRYMNNITIGINSSPYGKFLWISDHDAEMVTDFTLEEAKAFCAHMADKIIELEQM